MTTAAAPAPRARRRRGAAESLGSIVLVFESVVVFLAGLVVFGLNALPDAIPDWWGIVGGAVAAVIIILVSGMLRHRWAVIAGWILQFALLAAGFLVPAISVVALIFGAMWGYATIKGASLDRRNARLAAQADLSNGD